MINQIRSEFLKIRTVRSYWIMTVIAVLFSVLIGALAAHEMSEPAGVREVLFPLISLPPLFVLVLGVQVIGQEYRFATIRNTFSVTPRRGQVIGAKIIVVAICALACAAMFFVASVIGASVFGDGIVQFGDPNALSMTVGAFIFVVVLAEFGLAVGMILRQPTAAIAIGIIWATAAESMLSALAPSSTKWMPIEGVRRLGETSEELGGPMRESLHMSTISGGLYGTAVVALLLLVGAALTRSRDA